MDRAAFWGLEVPALPGVEGSQFDGHDRLEERVAFAMLTFLQARGFAPHSVDDGGDERIRTSTILEAMEAVFAVDEALVYVKGASGRYGISLVRGNSPWELIADHGVPLDDKDGFVAAMGQFCDALVAIEEVAVISDFIAALEA